VYGVADGWTATARPLDVRKILGALDDAGVEYIVVGAAAAIFHAWSGTTIDFDLVPRGVTANLNRLGRALRSIDAKVWADPARSDLLAEGKPPEADDFGFTAEGLRHARVWHLSTDAGPLDVAFDIAIGGGYDELIVGAERLSAFGIEVHVASLRQIIASKRALARPKDLRVLPELEDLLREQERRSNS